MSPSRLASLVEGPSRDPAARPLAGPSRSSRGRPISQDRWAYRVGRRPGRGLPRRPRRGAPRPRLPPPPGQCGQGRIPRLPRRAAAMGDGRQARTRQARRERSLPCAPEPLRRLVPKRQFGYRISTDYLFLKIGGMYFPWKNSFYSMKSIILLYFSIKICKNTDEAQAYSFGLIVVRGCCVGNLRRSHGWRGIDILGPPINSIGISS
jgi:hypothetical protein